MNNNLPAAALGHFVLKVDDIERSYAFYTKLGLRPAGIYPDLAIIELRGGTHILIFNKNEELPFPINASRIGQRSAVFKEDLDLMIEGKSRNDLELYRAALIEKGFTADAIAQDQLFGHDYFQLADPDGHGITFYSNHTGEQPV
jgi:catechol 2,3-dioxygenase-like lactoylglutathione lyase family enzyme